MATVSIDKDLAIDLIESKLREITGTIDSILALWKEKSAKEMIEKSRKGKLPESEMDAIALTNLLDRQQDLEKMLSNYGGN
ncbi:MAG: hypothetical protein GPJ54_00230 [Candidatus Heimdallarchaeota archaeon]|nr:hypothetical protein [Candidatus Heimdallarchaeota archaeon]